MGAEQHRWENSARAEHVRLEISVPVVVIRGCIGYYIDYDNGRDENDDDNKDHNNHGEDLVMDFCSQGSISNSGMRLYFGTQLRYSKTFSGERNSDSALWACPNKGESWQKGLALVASIA